MLEGNFGGMLGHDDAFGISLAVPGDHDCNGVPDLLVGAKGRVYLLRLRLNGTIESKVVLSATMPTPWAFGSGVTSLGDLDGDGASVTFP